MGRKHPEFPYSKPYNPSVSADVVLRQEPEEEDEEEEDDDKDDNHDDEDQDDGYSVSQAKNISSPKKAKQSLSALM